MLKQFLFSYISTVGFAIVFNIPKKAVTKSAFVGACGWVMYIYVNTLTASPVFASFMGACVAAIFSEIFARKFKEAVTVFVIPGILPLVPGAGMYHTMLAIIQENFNEAAMVGSSTIFIAGGIAAAILMVSSITRLLILKKI